MEQTVKRNRGRMVLVGVLAVSLLGNALSAGALLKLRNLRQELLGPSAEQAMFPRDIRSALRTAYDDNADALRPSLHALVAARAAVVASGTARPFDRAALEADMAAFRNEMDSILTEVQTMVADTLEAEAAQSK